MFVSQTSQYALRAIFALAKRYGKGPVKIAAIAEAQAIPPRFLEVILSQLKQGGFVESKRGNEGGYYLLRDPSSLAVGEVLRFIEGPVGPVDCIAGNSSKEKCPLHGQCVFLSMWRRIQKAISEVYGTTTFQELLNEESRMLGRYVPSYSI
jgi:Rrf2 family protein